MSEAGINSAPPAKRALVFRLPGKESADNAHILMRALENAGVPGELCPYWPDGEASWKTETVLLEREIGSAPRLTAVEFQQRFGFELDLVELSLHQFATEPLTPELLLPESVWRQHLRGVALLAAERMEASDADVVFVAHGAETVSRIIAEMAARLGMRFLYWESGFFPGYVYVDPWAPHFFRGGGWIDSLPMPAAPSQQTIDFLNDWLHTRESKYDQALEDISSAVSEWVAADDRPILFLPGQISTDANVVVNLGSYDSLSDLYHEVLRHVPSNWRVLYKPHPKAIIDPLLTTSLPNDRFLRADIHIHDAFALSTAVLTVSSNVGLEAILYGKPTLVLGQPVYAGRQLSFDISEYEKITDTLSNLPNTSRQDETNSRFLDLLTGFLINQNTHGRLRNLLCVNVPPRLSTRLSYYNSKTIDIVKLARLIAHDRFEKKNHPLLESQAVKMIFKFITLAKQKCLQKHDGGAKS
nr:hypothetical protein [Brevundimonas diminuta]